MAETRIRTKRKNASTDPAEIARVKRRKPGYDPAAEAAKAAEAPKAAKAAPQKRMRRATLNVPIEGEVDDLMTFEYEGALVIPPTEPKRNKNGQGFKPTDFQRKLVQDMTEWGVPQKSIRSYIINPMTGLPIDVNTLRDYFVSELEVGNARADARLAKVAYLQAVGRPAEYDEGGNLIHSERAPVPGMTKFLTFVRFGWGEDRADPAPVQDKAAHEILQDLKQLSPDEIRQIRDIARKRSIDESAAASARRGQIAVRKQPA